ELRGVMIRGRCEILEDESSVRTAFKARARAQANASPVQPGALASAPKRVVLKIVPEKVISWDHRKLGGRYLMAPASGGSSRRGLMIGVVVALPVLAHAGGSNYGMAPGARPELSGKISEWPVPTPQFARDPAPGPDGAIYIAVMFGNKIARFDPRTRA